MNDYAVLGAGAIGGTLAHTLASAGHNVTLIDSDEAHIRAIRERGLDLVSADGASDGLRMHRAVSTSEVDASGINLGLDRVFLATKAQHVAGAAEWLAPHLSTEATVVLCQNSDTFDAAGLWIDSDRIASAFVNFAADVLGPGSIRVGGPGALVLGEHHGPPSPRILSLVDDLAGIGDVTATDNITGYLWSKRGIAAILTATALVDEHVSVVIDSSREVMAELATEVYAVADTQGVRLMPLDGITPDHLQTTAEAPARDEAFDRLVAFTGSMPGKSRSGVFRDIAVRRRPTEARPDLLSLLQLAQDVGLRTPYLERLTWLIGELETGARNFGHHNLTELASGTTGARTASHY
ncbi:2-dehydropantoate 2-reductase N-terminal domain-containing protein [Arthrobacter sp. efr-133-TYG-118]|uniref:ketopantoate reductase family protein n=1 Tax=Arthrobacter sp. efr-133-TYG-118 TaxID=3040279 RepID=UPI002550D8EC|nr:2-dehydropantoate 2-reductase N-terminal domain-containing protein [Arthrobacter sp. efr-133-TYG-118]